MMLSVQHSSTNFFFGNIASTYSNLTDFIGMDCIFKEPTSPNTIKLGKNDVSILITSAMNSSEDFDPMTCFRVVKLNGDSNERWFRIFDFKHSLLESKESQKQGYLNFKAAKVDNAKCVLQIKASALRRGEHYAVVFMNLWLPTIPLATFDVE